MLPFLYTNLKLLVNKRAVQNKRSVVASIRRDSCNFLNQQINFVLQIGSVRCAIGAVGSLNG